MVPIAEKDAPNSTDDRANRNIDHAGTSGSEMDDEIQDGDSMAEGYEAWPEDTLMWVESSAPEVPQQAALITGKRPLGIQDTLFFLDLVKKQFADNPGVYNKFLDIMKGYKNQDFDTPSAIKRVSSLFADYPQLIQAFSTFLPAGYRIERTVDANEGSIITITTPNGTTVHGQDSETCGGHNYTAPTGDDLLYSDEQLYHAVEYVTKIKQRFMGREDLFREFVDILKSYECTPLDKDQLVQRIADLFQDSPDLLSGLRQFIPQEMFNPIEGSVATGKKVKTSQHGK